MTSKGLIYCPYSGCGQTSRRQWNMKIHIKRKHNKGQPASPSTNGSKSVLNSTLSSSFSNRKEFTRTSNYMHEVPYRQDIFVDDSMNAKRVQDQLIENILWLDKAKYLFHKLDQHTSSSSATYEIAKLLMMQMLSNSNQSKKNISVKRERFPAGYRLSLCDRCLSGSGLHSVPFPLEFWALLKPIHTCSSMSKNVLDFPSMKCQAEEKMLVWMERVVFSRIRMNHICLKIVDVPGTVFTKEGRSLWKLPPNMEPIEADDCIEINICENEHCEAHWSCRAIKESTKMMLSKEELMEFIKITRSTFGIFQESSKNRYLLLYLIL